MGFCREQYRRHPLVAGRPGGGKAEYRNAIDRFESANKAFTENGYLPVITIVDQKIALVKEAMTKK
jgi:hypothetical protein